jgi:hypothetical protein
LSMTLIHLMKVETGDLMKWQNKDVQELAGEFNQKHLSLGLFEFLEASNCTILVKLLPIRLSGLPLFSFSKKALKDFENHFKPCIYILK